jgi:hypothetical protein
MSFLSNAVTHRKIVLFCARLFVQCMMGWSTSQVGMDEAIFFVPHRASDPLIARHEPAGATHGPFRNWKPYQTV